MFRVGCPSAWVRVNGEGEETADRPPVWRVADQGPGIAKEIQDELFQPFTSFGKRNGLGLGLALSRETVLEHGGDIWATQAAPRGAVFHVKLPVG